GAGEDDRHAAGASLSTAAGVRRRREPPSAGGVVPSCRSSDPGVAPPRRPSRRRPPVPVPHPMNRLSLLAAAAAFAPAVLGAQSPQPEPTAVVPAPATTLPLKLEPRPTVAGITPEDLMTRLYIFADDSMQGREAGTIGNVRATDYIAAEAKRLGLYPAGQNGTYFQTIPLKTRGLATDSRLVVAGSPLTLGTDWAAAGTASLTKRDIPTVYG